VTAPAAAGRLRAVTVYFEPRVLAILFLGFSSGVPLALTGQTLSVWMKEAGVSLAAIGAFSLVGLPYVLKFMWAPLVDATSVPLLGRLLGRRRGWLAATQIVTALAVLGLGLVDPAAAPVATALLAVAVAFASATQDIVVDAYRVERLDESRAAAGMANYVAGYRVALLVSTAGAFEIATLAQQSGFAGNAGWAVTYAAMAALLGVGLLATLLSGEPAAGDSSWRAGAPLAARFRAAAIDPFVDFVRRRDWLLILLFVVCFKLADAMAGVMTAPFVIDIGFSRTDYGRVVKIFGFAATLAGGFAGGAVARRLPVLPGLWLAGWAQALSNLLFVWLALAGPHMQALVVTNIAENFAGGFGTVIFVAYLSGLCGTRAYTATQYALLSALAAVARTVLAAPAGVLAAALGWPVFFALTALAAAPGLMLLWWLGRRQPPSAQSA
jgi:PAT family beta-lactamase induction signal transducer AmpG